MNWYTRRELALQVGAAQLGRAQKPIRLELTEDERERLVLWLSVSIGAVSQAEPREAKVILDFVDSRLRRPA